MAAELAASIVAAASTLHEQHTERKILRVIEDSSYLHFLSTVGQEGGTLRESKDMRELWLVWHEKESLDSRPDSHWTWPVPRVYSPAPSGFDKMRVPLEKMLAAGWTIEREIKPAADVSYLVLARTAPRQPAASS